jgi:NAD(P)H-dependent FMN reductase
MNILAFSGSNSSTSINQSLIRCTAEKIGGNVINLRDYEFPMYSEDLEREKGIPADIYAIMEKMQSADAVIISTPEHNANLPAFFKNVLDWLSRTKVKFLAGKKVLIMSTSNGQGGAAKAAGLMDRPVRYAGGEIFETFSLPGFKDHFDQEKDVFKKEEWNAKLDKILEDFLAAIKSE